MTNARASSSTLVAATLVAIGASMLGGACGDDTGGGGGDDGASTTASTSTTTTSATTTTTTTASTSSSTTGAGGSGGGGGAAPSGPTLPTDADAPWDTLSAWNLFVDPTLQVPTDRVEPYRVVAPLFSDEAAKLRFLYVPEGETIHYEDVGPWGFPEGSVLIKTFAYPEDARDEASPLHLMETRLLWRVDGAWSTLTYVWNEEQTEAVRKSAGDVIPVTWVDETGADRALDYVVPNTNQCKECHRSVDDLVTLGGRTVQLDFDAGSGNQVDRFAELGLFDAAPTPAAERVHMVDPFGDDDVDLRARSYLHGNCAHCHTATGAASNSGLWLDFAESDPVTDPANLGICKVPAAAGGATCGLSFDIVPGDPDASIMICRVESVDTQVRMPPLARQLVHGQGVALLREFIEALPPSACE